MGSADFRAVLKHAIEIFKLKFQYFVTNITQMDSLFEVTFSPLAKTGKSHSRCGKCRRYMKYIQSKPSRLHCSHCDETYSLPIGGIVRVYRELKCPLDEFELITWSNGNKGRSYSLCPYCYNYPPFKEMQRYSGCNNCAHPTCQHSLASLGVCNCVECDRGVLVLDATAAPKNWKLGCNNNSCDVIINCFDDAIKVSVEDKICESCESQMVTAVYKSDKTPFFDLASEKTACVFCSADFKPLVSRNSYFVKKSPKFKRFTYRLKSTRP